MMNILMIGDIVGRAGRLAVEAHLPKLKNDYALDLVIANGDNAAHGIGITPSVVKDLYALGIDLITGGDHVWQHKEMLTHMDRAPWVLRPANLPNGTPGKGHMVLETASGKKLLVVHAMGRVFMNHMADDPFAAIDTLLKRYNLGQDIDGIVVDYHAEATSEKCAIGHYLDGRVSAVVGTHTHIPTADARVLSKGTAYMTDLGMTADYDSVLGVEKEVPIANFRTSLKLNRFSPAMGDGTLCGAVITIADNGLATSITPIRIGGQLDPI